MLVVDEATRDQGRKLIHQNKVTFDEWLKLQHPNAEPDTGSWLFLTSWLFGPRLTCERPIDPVQPLGYPNYEPQALYNANVYLLYAIARECG